MKVEPARYRGQTSSLVTDITTYSQYIMNLAYIYLNTSLCHPPVPEEIAAGRDNERDKAWKNIRAAGLR